MAEARSGWPPDDEYLESRTPRVELADAVARLQKDLEEYRAESGYGSARSRRFLLRPRVGLDLRQRQCQCMRGSPIGTNIGKCLRLSFVRMGGTESRQPFNLCLRVQTSV